MTHRRRFRTDDAGVRAMSVNNFIQKLSLEEVLPHAEPMILLSDYDLPGAPDSVTAYVDVDEDSPFFESGIGGVPACVALEYMAQAMALATGLKRIANGLSPRIGFILGSRRLDMDIPFFSAGSRYRIEVACTYSDDTFGSFDCGIFDAGGVRVAGGILTAFQPDGNMTPERLEEFK